MMRVFEQFARNFYRRHCHAYDSSLTASDARKSPSPERDD